MQLRRDMRYRSNILVPHGGLLLLGCAESFVQNTPQTERNDLFPATISNLSLPAYDRDITNSLIFSEYNTKIVCGEGLRIDLLATRQTAFSLLNQEF